MLGTLTVSFTVAASEGAVDPVALTASFSKLPTAHGGPGSEAFTIELAFSEPHLSYKTLRKWSLWVADGSLGFVRRLDPPLERELNDQDQALEPSDDRPHDEIQPDLQ